MTPPRAPSERMLPAWLAVSLLVHAVVFAGAALLPRTEDGPAERAMRVVVAGKVTPPRPAADPSLHRAPAAETEVGGMQITSPAQPQRRAAQQPSRRTNRPEPADPSPAGSTGREQSVARTSEAARAGGDRLADMRPGTSASAPRMGRAGAPVDGPVAGGGAQPLTRTSSGPSGFAVTAPEPAGGMGPGLGGSGSGLGAGGSASGVGGGGTPGGQGPGAGGQGGSGHGYIASRGTVGAGPGRGTAGGPRARSAPAPQSRSQPQPRRQPDPTPEPGPAPEPPAESRAEAAPEPPPEREPEPTQADLSRFRSMVQSRINSARRYPASARQQGWAGTARVSFSVTPSGSTTGISLASSSGYQALDNEALRAVRRAAPYRPFPKGLSTPIRVSATVVFRLH